MDRRTVSLDDGSLRFRYFGKFQCGIAVFYYFLCGFAVFGPSLRPPRWAMRVSRSDGLRCDFSANKLTISLSYMGFCDFNSKSDGRRYDFFFHLNTALPFPLQNLVQRLRSQTPSSVSSTPNEVSAIPCVLFGNTLRALFFKNRDFLLLRRNFPP